MGEKSSLYKGKISKIFFSIRQGDMIQQNALCPFISITLYPLQIIPIHLIPLMVRITHQIIQIIINSTQPQHHFQLAILYSLLQSYLSYR